MTVASALQPFRLQRCLRHSPNSMASTATGRLQAVLHRFASRDLPSLIASGRWHREEGARECLSARQTDSGTGPHSSLLLQEQRRLLEPWAKNAGCDVITGSEWSERARCVRTSACGLRWRGSTCGIGTAPRAFICGRKATSRMKRPFEGTILHSCHERGTTSGDLEALTDRVFAGVPHRSAHASAPI